MSVLRLIPKVRQTAALVAPPSSAAMTAAIFSASIATGRPPRRRAAARPALTRSRVSDRSNCASAPKTWNRNSPCGVVVSICSVSERNAPPRSFSSFTVASRWGSDRPRRSSFHTTKAIARLQEGQRLRKAATIVAAAAGAIFEQMPLVNSRCQQGVALQIQDLAVAVGRDTHVSDHHARKSPVDRFPHATPLRQGLSYMFCGRNRGLNPLLGRLSEITCFSTAS